MRLKHLASALDDLPVEPPNSDTQSILPSERTVRNWKARAPRFALLLVAFPELRQALDRDIEELAQRSEMASFLP